MHLLGHMGYEEGLGCTGVRPEKWRMCVPGMALAAGNTAVNIPTLMEFSV